MKVCPSIEALKRGFFALTGPVAAMVVLLPLAAVSIALACAGADVSLRLLRIPALILLVLALSQFLVLVAFRSCRRLPALLLHLGFVLVLGGWAVNAWGLHTGTVPAPVDVPLREGDFAPVGRDFQVVLKSFRIDHWPDTGTPRQYTSRVHFVTMSAAGRPAAEQAEISVNHPARYKGWWLYQSSCGMWTDPESGARVPYTVLRGVRDVGLPFAAAGGVLLVLGAFLFAVRSWREGAA